MADGGEEGLVVDGEGEHASDYAALIGPTQATHLLVCSRLLFWCIHLDPWLCATGKPEVQLR